MIPGIFIFIAYHLDFKSSLAFDGKAIWSAWAQIGLTLTLSNTNLKFLFLSEET